MSSQDTTQLVFTKQYGFRFSSCSYRALAPKQRVLDVDFDQDCVGMWRHESRQQLVATRTGTVHAVLASWEVYDGEADELVMSTHPDDTRDNFPRDMQWGQALQLIEDLACAGTRGQAPTPFRVTEGEALVLVTRYSVDGITMQFQLERDVASSAQAGRGAGAGVDGQRAAKSSKKDDVGGVEYQY